MLLAPAESVSCLGFVNKQGYLTSCGRPSVHIVILYCRVLSYCSPVCMIVCNFYKQQ